MFGVSFDKKNAKTTNDANGIKTYLQHARKSGNVDLSNRDFDKGEEFMLEYA